jgi:NAD+ synthase
VDLLNLTSSALERDWSETKTRIIRFIRDYIEKAGANGVVLGLSGGIDSCTVAALSSEALGGSKVLGLMLPENETKSPRDTKHARLVAKKFELKIQEIDITNTLATFYTSIQDFDPSDKVSKGNIKARTRMSYIYYYANRLGNLVCGSSDKSEAMIGYFTKWGDVAADISPVMDLYKTQVRNLAAHMGIPTEIISKPPTPALWPGQLAEHELGMKYDQLDLVLYGLEHFVNSHEIATQLNISTKAVNRIKHRWLSAEHKRRMPLTAKFEYRTVGSDFRLPRVIS